MHEEENGVARAVARHEPLPFEHCNPLASGEAVGFEFFLQFGDGLIVIRRLWSAAECQQQRSG